MYEANIRLHDITSSKVNTIKLTVCKHWDLWSLLLARNELSEALLHHFAWIRNPWAGRPGAGGGSPPPRAGCPGASADPPSAGTASHTGRRQTACIRCVSSCGLSGCCSGRRTWYRQCTCAASPLKHLDVNNIVKSR